MEQFSMDTTIIQLTKTQLMGFRLFQQAVSSAEASRNSFIGDCLKELVPDSEGRTFLFDPKTLQFTEQENNA